MIFRSNGDGSATLLPDTAPGGELPCGGGYFATLAGTVAHNGVQATAFDGRAKIELVMSGAEWVETGRFTAREMRLAVRIAAEDGALVIPTRLHISPVTRPFEPGTLAEQALLRAWAQVGLGQFNEAVGAFEMALRHDPSPRTAATLRALAEHLPRELPAFLFEAFDAIEAPEAIHDTPKPGGPIMAKKTFDEAVDDAVHATLARFGLKAVQMIDTAESLNDAFSEIFGNIADRDGRFPGASEYWAHRAGNIEGEADFDQAVDDATERALRAMELRLETAIDTGELIGEAIAEHLRNVVDFSDEPEDDDEDLAP